MGSLARKMKRQAERRAFDRFTEAFNSEKRYQLYLKDKGESLPEGQPKLGRKPPLNVWKQAVAEAKDRLMKQAAEQIEKGGIRKRAELKQVDEDLEWEEKKANGEVADAWGDGFAGVNARQPPTVPMQTDPVK